MEQKQVPAPYLAQMDESREENGQALEREWESRAGRWAVQWEFHQMPMEVRFEQMWEHLPQTQGIQQLPVERRRLLMRLWQERLEDAPGSPTPENVSVQQLEQMMQEVNQVELSQIEAENLRA